MLTFRLLRSTSGSFSSMFGNHWLQPAAMLELTNQPDVGLEKLLVSIPPRLDHLAHAQHRSGGLRDRAPRRCGENSHAERGFGVFGERHRPPEHVGAQLAPVPVAGAPPSQAEVSEKWGIEHVQVVKGKPLDISSSLEKGGELIDLISGLT